MRRLIGSAAVTALVTGMVISGAAPVSASCHIVNFSEPSYTAEENAGTVTIKIERQIFGNGCPGTINYTTEDDSAKDPADYKKTSGTFAYASTESSKSFTVPIVNDSDQEGEETFKVTFNGSSPGAVTGSAIVTIQDDEDVLSAGAASPSPEVIDAQTTAEEDEDDGTPIGLIVAIAAGAVVLILAVVLLLRRRPA